MNNNKLLLYMKSLFGDHVDVINGNPTIYSIFSKNDFAIDVKNNNIIYHEIKKGRHVNMQMVKYSDDYVELIDLLKKKYNVGAQIALLINKLKIINHPNVYILPSECSINIDVDLSGKYKVASIYVYDSKIFIDTPQLITNKIENIDDAIQKIVDILSLYVGNPQADVPWYPGTLLIDIKEYLKDTNWTQIIENTKIYLVNNGQKKYVIKCAKDGGFYFSTFEQDTRCNDNIFIPTYSKLFEKISNIIRENKEMLANIEHKINFEYSDDATSEPALQCISCTENIKAVRFNCKHTLYCRKCYFDWKKLYNKCSICKKTVNSISEILL